MVVLGLCVCLLILLIMGSMIAAFGIIFIWNDYLYTLYVSRFNSSLNFIFFICDTITMLDL